MAFHTTYKDIIDGLHHSDESQLSIETSPIINHRRNSLGTTDSFWAFYRGVAVSVDCGTRITVPIDLNTSLPVGNNHEIMLEDFEVIKMDKGDDPCLDCKTGPQWCVSTPNLTDRNKNTLLEASLSADELVIYRVLKYSSKSLGTETTENTSESTRNGRNSTQFSTEVNQNLLSTYPSDIITFLRPSRDNNVNGRFICLLISSYVSNLTSSASERIVCIDTICDQNNHAFSRSE